MIAKTINEFLEENDQLPSLVSSVRNQRNYAKYDTFDLNNGMCMPIAKAVRKLASAVGIKTVLLDTEKFQGELLDDETAKSVWGINARRVPELDELYWNDKMLAQYGQPPLPPAAPIQLDYHAWVFANGKHYDVEAPEGVPTMWDLPFFKRNLRSWIRSWEQNQSPTA